MYYKNHLIKKKMSQIFLQDPTIINTIINLINIKKNQKIIEIGPGFGALTKHIIKIVDFLIAIELDQNLSTQLLRMFYKKNIKIFNQDIINIDFYYLFQKNKQKMRLIGNLPYHISTKIIIHLLKYINVIHDMHFMFQKEVAARLLAQPNNKNYGSLSIITQYYYKIIPLLNIPKTAFFPIPKVESMMIKLSPHNNSPYPAIDITQLSILTKLAFSQRRKIIKNSLSTLFNVQEMKNQGIDITLRAENLTIYQYCILTKILTNKINSQKNKTSI